MLVLCPDCSKKLSSYGTNCEEIVSILCELQTIIINDITLHRECIRFLENKGYLVSSEVGNDKIGMEINISSMNPHAEADEACWCVIA